MKARMAKGFRSSRVAAVTLIATSAITGTALLHISDSAPGSPQSLTLRGIGTEGYYLAGVKGTVAHFGDARAHGSLLGRRLSAPIISMTATQNGGGYWLLGSDGGIFSFGN